MLQTIRRERRKAAVADPVAAARAIGLRYVREMRVGFARTPNGIVDVDGKPLEDPEHLERIRSLVIPPAWERVWICPLPQGHLQAVGYDARGRKQYRYHPLYSSHRNQTKFSRMPEFGRVLPEIRSRVEADLRKHGLPREKVLATVVRLLETTCIRVGNLEYARENKSFGLTTMRDRHVDVHGAIMRFHFRGKSAQDHDIQLRDKRLARIVKECQDLPGYELFQYLDDAGEQHAVDSHDVNEYLKGISGGDFTAKDFRTWAGTRQAALELVALGPGESETEKKRKIVAAVKSVAEKLGNRPATSRKYYVHPVVLDSYANGSLFEFVNPVEGELALPSDALHPTEEQVL
ncbi:MAG: DNA topoisomerase IB, partial [Acidobacteriota bacterium]|nr:DNA topoisomerase IB [Acidobacteriota bacterium]